MHFLAQASLVLTLLMPQPLRAAQPTAPEPFEAPLRDLRFGQLNFLHTTDTHGWHAGHLLEASYSADWGDYVDFAARLREKLEAEGKDLLLVDTGDRVEGNGLYDASEPKGLFTFDIFREQHMDIICAGNHELYKRNSSENEYLITAPAYTGSYIASNLDIIDPHTGQLVPLAPRYKKFTTKNQGIRIMAFGFIFDFTGNYNNTVVHAVESAVKEQWFQDAIRDREIDLFVVAGHVTLRAEEFDAIYRAIRSVRWDTPIQFFGGHFHIRDYRRFDGNAFGLASGRFMETIGFQSIDGLPSHGGAVTPAASATFFRRYIDNNLYSLYHHSGHNSTTFHSERGLNISKAIQEARAALDLDQTFGCAPKDLWMSSAPYPSNDSIFTWLEEEVFPGIMNDTSRGDKPRLVITNTGAIRFDIFKGAFTKDSTYIVSPFTSGFHYIKDVPYDRASKLISILNGGSGYFTELDSSLATWKLQPPEQLSISEDRIFADGSPPLSLDSQAQVPMSSHFSLKPGYTTVDDAGSDGDDTLHSPINFYRVPNCIQSLINTTHSDLEEGTVDLIFNEFIQPWVLLGLRFLGLEYSDAAVGKYMPDENFTTLLTKWATMHWKKNCPD